MNLRPYQAVMVDELRKAYGRGKRSLIAVLPTGGGKTFTFAYMARGAAAKGNRVCIIVHRRELLKQASLALSTLSVDHGIIAPGFSPGEFHVYVASIQTLSQRLKRGKVPEFDFLIFDEAHHLNAKTWLDVSSSFPKAKQLGVTATPCRSDGKGLGVHAGGIFEEMIEGPSIGELIEMGFLVRPKVFGPPVQLDLSGVRRSMGDFNTKQLSERVDKPAITGSAVEHYKRLCSGLPAVAFCVNVAHAEHVASEFTGAGFPSRPIHGGLSIEERERVVEDLDQGRITVMTAVDVVSEGFDLPRLKCAILLRPTQSLSLYLQQVGRVLRPTDSGSGAFVLDHAGNYLRHGLPDDDQDWTLDGIVKNTSKSSGGVRIRQCEKCYAVFEWADTCPDCGAAFKAKERKINEVEGELTEVTKEQMEILKKERVRRMKSARTVEDIERVARENGYKPGWVYMRKRALGLI
jgi:DNA repair protein RadD